MRIEEIVPSVPGAGGAPAGLQTGPAPSLSGLATVGSRESEIPRGLCSLAQAWVCVCGYLDESLSIWEFTAA